MYLHELFAHSVVYICINRPYVFYLPAYFSFRTYKIISTISTYETVRIDVRYLSWPINVEIFIISYLYMKQW